MSMLGNQESYNLNAKAAESHGLLRFVEHLLHEYADVLPGLDPDMSRKLTLLQAAAKSARAMDEILAQGERFMDRPQCQAFFNCYIRFLTLYMRAGGVWRPKCHLLLHLCQRALLKGNPRLYSTYRDESLNGTIAKIARSAHRRTWGNVIQWKCAMFHLNNFRKYIGEM